MFNYYKNLCFHSILNTENYSQQPFLQNTTIIFQFLSIIQGQNTTNVLQTLQLKLLLPVYKAH